MRTLRQVTPFIVGLTIFACSSTEPNSDPDDTGENTGDGDGDPGDGDGDGDPGDGDGDGDGDGPTGDGDGDPGDGDGDGDTGDGDGDTGDGDGDQTGDGDGDGGSGPGGSGNAPSNVQKTLDTQGGSIEALGTTLLFPPGALSEAVQVQVAVLSENEAAALPQLQDDIAPLGTPVRFEPHGTTFDQPVEVTLDYSTEALDTDQLVVLKLDDETDTTWEYVPGATFENGKAVFSITSFSLYGVFKDPNGVAQQLYAPPSGGDGDGDGSGGGAPTGGDGSGGAPTGGDGSGGGAPTGGDGSGGGAPTGGDGSGGAPTGGDGDGDGSGGAPTGGDGDGEGGYGGVGGMGGSGGDDESPNGYLNEGPWFGYGWTMTSSGSTVLESDLEDSDFPNYVRFELGASPVDYGALLYNLSQSEAGEPPAAILLEGDGVFIDYGSDFNITRLQLVDEATQRSWCAAIGFGGFTPWTAFNTHCWNTEDPEAQSFNPLADGVTALGLIAASSGPSEEEEDPHYLERGWLSIDTLIPSTTPVFGYFDQGGFRGDAFTTLTTPGVEFSSNHAAQWRLPVGAEGEVPDSYEERFVLSFNLNQATSGGPEEFYTPTRDGLQFDLGSSGEQLRVILSDGSNEWCAQLYNDDDSFVPWTAFNSSCWDDSGVFYAGEPLRWIGFSVPGDVADTQWFDFTVYGFQDADRGEYGRWYSDYVEETPEEVFMWSGYATASHQGATWAKTNAGRSNRWNDVCMQGELEEDSSGAGHARLLLSLNEWGDQLDVVHPAFDGLEFDHERRDATVLRAVIIDEDEVEYCADLAPDQSYVSWGSFSTECWNPADPGSLYDGETPLLYAGLVVPSLLDDGHRYEICLDSVEPRLAPRYGYMQSNSFHGFAWTAASSPGDPQGALGSSISSNLASSEDEFCAEGVLGNAYPDYAMVGFNLNQEYGEETPVDGYVPTNDGLYLSGRVESGCDNDTRVEVRFSIQDIHGNNYCAPVTQLEPCDYAYLGARHQVPWTSFATECWTDGGTAYDGTTPLRAASIQVLPIELDGPSDYQLCLSHAEDREEDPYGEEGGWGGSGGF